MSSPQHVLRQRRQTILYAQIDPSEVVKAKYDFDVTGHYARPDVFQLTVDTRAKQAVREH